MRTFLKQLVLVTRFQHLVKWSEKWNTPKWKSVWDFTPTFYWSSTTVIKIRAEPWKVDWQNPLKTFGSVPMALEISTKGPVFSQLETHTKKKKVEKLLEWTFLFFFFQNLTTCCARNLLSANIKIVKVKFRICMAKGGRETLRPSYSRPKLTLVSWHSHIFRPIILQRIGHTLKLSPLFICFRALGQKLLGVIFMTPFLLHHCSPRPHIRWYT